MLLFCVNITIVNSECDDPRLCQVYPWFYCCQNRVISEPNCGIIGESRIYGGNPVILRDLPWMAVIYYERRKDPHCGASIISRRFLLTAAHCVTGTIIKHYGEP